MKIIAGEDLKPWDLVYFVREHDEVFAFKLTAALDATDVEFDTAPPPAAPAAEHAAKPEEKESLKDIKMRARKPPADGPCKRCGENKPINRLMLCYPCWVKSELEKHGWREGQPHPDFCACDLDCRFDSRWADN